MANWVLKGLRTGIRTTSYPARAENGAGRFARAARAAPC